jgi:hypothetical protein
MSIGQFDIAVPTDDGQWVSQSHMRIAEIIRDYEPTLSLVWIPIDQRSEADRGREFAVIHSPIGGPVYTVLHCSADEVDHRLLARLFNGDLAKNNVLNWLDSIEEAKAIIKAKQDAELAEERQEIVRSIIKSPKSVYKHNGVKYR